jgi:hypothetical protein
MLLSHLAFSSILKREAAFSSVTSVRFQRITRRYIPEDGSLALTAYLEFVFRNGSFKTTG